MSLETIPCCLCKESKLTELQKTKLCGLSKCLSCGLVFLNPRPDKLEHVKFHRSGYFTRYYNESVKQFYRLKGKLYQRIRCLNMSRLNLIRRYVPQGTLLDVGAGQGMFITIAKQSGFQVTAIDILEDVASYFNLNGYDYRSGYLEELSLPSNIYDAVTMWHSLEHTLNPYNTLKGVNRVLKDNGYLFIAVPNFDSIILRINLFLNRPFFSNASTEIHYFQFTRNTLARLLRESGFQLIHYRPDLRESLKSSWRTNVSQVINWGGSLIYRLIGQPHYANILLVAQKTLKR